MKTGNVLVVTNWAFEDGLIQSYTLPYLKIIHQINPRIKIFLITQEKSGLERNWQKRKSIEEDLYEHNIILLPEKYYRAGLIKYLATGFYFLRHIPLILFKGIQYIHSFCTPAGGYGYILSKLTGKKLVVDSYEPHSEYMLECGVWNEKQFAYKALNKLEKRQAESAYHLIATTPSMITHAERKYGIQIRGRDVKPACVDLEHFVYDEKTAGQIRNSLGIESKIVCVYAGKFGDFYLEDEVFGFYKVAFGYWKERFHVLLLSNLSRQKLDAYCERFDLPKDSFTLMSVAHHLVPKYLSSADFGLSPYRPTPSKKFCTPIKDGEYWAVGLPVVITNDISIDSDLIEKNDIGYVLKGLDDREYLNAVLKIDKLLEENREELRKKIRQIANEERSYSIAETIYKKIYS